MQTYRNRIASKASKQAESMQPAVQLPTRNSIPVATDDEARSAFDYTSRFYTGLSGEEFLRRLDAGQLDTTSRNVELVLTMLSFVR